MPVSVLYAAVLAVALLLWGSLMGRSLGASIEAVAANYATGFAALALLNWLGPRFGLFVPVNAVTLLAGGCLGAPGAALAAALQFVA